MADDKSVSALRRNARNYHQRQAAHFRALAANAATDAVKGWLLRQAEVHERAIGEDRAPAELQPPLGEIGQ